MNALRVDINLFLISFEKFISKPSSFDSFLTINLKDYIMIINEIIDTNERFSDVEILLLLCLYRLKTNNILSFRISRITLYLFIYNFLKIKL